METYSQIELSRILQFCTGTSRLPIEGFRALESNRGEKSMFCIQQIQYNNTKRNQMSNVPKAHTCFNRLELPKYPDYETLKLSLDYVAKNDIVGFGLEG